MTNFILIPELTIDSLDENPFFASSDPEDEGKGTSGLFGDSDSDWEELDGGLYSYFTLLILSLLSIYTNYC